MKIILLFLFFLNCDFPTDLYSNSDIVVSYFPQYPNNFMYSEATVYMGNTQIYIIFPGHTDTLNVKNYNKIQVKFTRTNKYNESKHFYTLDTTTSPNMNWTCYDP